MKLFLLFVTWFIIGFVIVGGVSYWDLNSFEGLIWGFFVGFTGQRAWRFVEKSLVRRSRRDRDP